MMPSFVVPLLLQSLAFLPEVETTIPMISEGARETAKLVAGRTKLGGAAVDVIMISKATLVWWTFQHPERESLNQSAERFKRNHTCASDKDRLVCFMAGAGSILVRATSDRAGAGEVKQVVSARLGALQPNPFSWLASRAYQRVDLLDVKTMAPFYDDVKHLRGRVPDYTLAGLVRTGSEWRVTIERPSDHKTATVRLDKQFKVLSAALDSARIH